MLKSMPPNVWSPELYRRGNQGEEEPRKVGWEDDT